MFSTFRCITLLLCLLALGGCNISTTTLGEGSITLISDNAIPCSGRPDCYDGGYNRAITFTAQPAPGYLFSGWAGDCSGLQQCTVHTLGNRHVIATFRSLDDLVPIMNYTDDFFFSGPWPSDLRRHADGTLDLKDFPREKGLLFPGVKSAASKMNGFARNGVLYIPIARNLDMGASNNLHLSSGTASSTLQLVNLSPDSAHYLDIIPLVMNLVVSDNLEKGVLLAIQPAPGRSLDAETTYGLILFQDDVQFQGATTGIRPDPVMRALIAGQSSGPLVPQWNTIKAYVDNHTARTAEQVAAFSLFTTQPDPAAYSALRDFYRDYDYTTNFAGVSHFVEPDVSYYGNLAYNNCAGTTATVRAFTLHAPTPRFLSGKPPYALSGGRIQYDANGHVTALGQYTTTDITVVEPCEEPPEDGWPVEIMAMGTGQNADDYGENIDEHYYQSRHVVQVIVPAPYTIGDGRVFPDGTENIERLSNLLNISQENLLLVSTDVNPLNIESILNNHLQYAGDLVYALNFIERFPAYLAQHPMYTYLPGDAVNEMAGLRINPQKIAFRGFSLGSVAALHANAITDAAGTIMVDTVPRTQVNHINNLVQWVEDKTDVDIVSLLNTFLGVTFPMDTMSPFAALIQTAVDPVDIINRVPDLANKNILLGLGEFEDSIHGGDESYSFATAIDNAYGISPVTGGGNPVPMNDNQPQWPLIRNSDGDMIDYMPSSEVVEYGDILTRHPLRIAVRSSVPAMTGLANGFLYQMSTRTDFDTGYSPY